MPSTRTCEHDSNTTSRHHDVKGQHSSVRVVVCTAPQFKSHADLVAENSEKTWLLNAERSLVSECAQFMKYDGAKDAYLAHEFQKEAV